MSTITNISPVVQRGQLTPRLDTLSRPAGALALDAKARQFKAMLASALGGHAAEAVVFGQVSNGAENDLERATSIARRSAIASTSISNQRHRPSPTSG